MIKEEITKPQETSTDPTIMALLDNEQHQKINAHAQAGVVVDLPMVLMDSLIDVVLDTPALRDALGLAYRARIQRILTEVDTELAHRALLVPEAPHIQVPTSPLRMV